MRLRTAFALVFSVVACSTGSSSSSGPPSEADGGGAGADAAGPSGPSGSEPKVDFCAVLTKPLAAQIMGNPVKDAEPRSGNDLTSCQYSRDAAGGLEAAQSIEGSYVYYSNAAAGRTAFDTAYGHQPSETPVAGVGDACFVVEGSVSGFPSVSLNAYQGHYYVTLSAVGASASAMEDGAKQIFAALAK